MHFLAMKAHFYKNSVDERLYRRITELGFHCQEFTENTIGELNQDSWDSVYLIGWDQIQNSSLWPEIRQKLTLSNRFFLCIGESLSSEQIVKAMKDGAFDVMLMNDSDTRWSNALTGAAQSQNLWIQVYGGNKSDTGEILLGDSKEMVSLRQNVQRLGPTDATVLIMGESGAGKEKVAEALHHASGSENFVAVNCAAIPKDLIESELFGAEKGAYTGAQARKGLVEQAHNGTLFLDEIGELDITLQPKLLRFLETRTFRRVGSSKDMQVNLRVIAATNRQLEKEISIGRFRGDLYFRLSEITLRIPPLRMRTSDIPIFTKLFMERANERFGKNFEIIEPELIQKLQTYSWPGNVRELKSHIDRLVLMQFGSTLRATWWDIPETSIHGAIAEMHATQQLQPSTHQGFLDSRSPTPFDVTPVSHNPAGHNNAYPSQKERMMKAKELLSTGDFNLAHVAAQLGIHPTTLYRWRKQGKV